MNEQQLLMHLSLSNKDFDILESELLETHIRDARSNFFHPKDPPGETYELRVYQTPSKSGESPVYRVRTVA